MNEKHFNLGILVVVVSVVGYLIYGGSLDLNAFVGMFGAVGFNIIFLLGIGFGLQYFQLGTNKDIQVEIYDEHNVAAAIYQAGIWIALALVIAKGVL
jgi:uncharacterized membrane protein YjfL (UPF0719 family)